MAEEQQCEAPAESHLPCANNCGLFGSPATMNLCPTCYGDHRLKEQQLPSSTSSSSFRHVNVTSAVSAASPAPPEVVLTTETRDDVSSKITNRCLACRKRVGLMGFKCRCGATFCGSHRYPEKHACTFDFKKSGREEIARANPLVVADKLRKI